MDVGPTKKKKRLLSEARDAKTACPRTTREIGVSEERFDARNVLFHESHQKYSCLINELENDDQNYVILKT